uniref:LIM zinc-binding domain-containing protein n=1 Tax=Ditylenchus dipsaci TaxID=166011 RepID=A0A915DPG1_9BILA
MSREAKRFPTRLHHGIHTIPKGDCAFVANPLWATVVIALGKMWHPEHYVCCHCGEEIGHRNFFERGGKAYCETDYHDCFHPDVSTAMVLFVDVCITALGKTFHPEHFLCNQCGRPLDDAEGFHEKRWQAFCKEDFYRTYAPSARDARNPLRTSLSLLLALIGTLNASFVRLMTTFPSCVL